MRARRAILWGLFLPCSLAATGPSGRCEAMQAPDAIRAHEQIAASVVMVAVEGTLDAQATATTREYQATGSGFAIEPGLVVTNYHVIARATRIEVVLRDRRKSAPAVIVGTAPEFDVALLRVPFGKSALPPARLASAREAKVGQSVVAVSHPFGLRHSVSIGVISGLNRELPGLALGSSAPSVQCADQPGPE